ncbi:MAG: DUF6089 family protein [Tenuifilaceae bacterium]|jgi:hypothetical protein|nr:DUF6089 family protein [Tenuifilaceae bacterium]
MRKFIVPLFISLLLANTSSAQSWKAAKLEVFGGISAHQYFGDIGGASGDVNLLGLLDIDILSTRPGITLGARYHISKPIQIKVNFTSGMISSTDLNSRNENRQFAFKTLINEFAVMGEYYIIPESDENYFYNIMQIRGGLRHFRQPFSLYATLGFGGFHYNVTPLQNLATSPRFSQSSSIAFFVPVGMGIKYAIRPKLSIGVELVGRITNTNELDGYVSPYGIYNDYYHSLIVKVNYKIPTKKRPGVRR